MRVAEKLDWKGLIIAYFANTKYRNNKCFTLLRMLTLKLCEECKANNLRLKNKLIQEQCIAWMCYS
jgi:hypothetical protein